MGVRVRSHAREPEALREQGTYRSAGNARRRPAMELVVYMRLMIGEGRAGPNME